MHDSHLLKTLMFGIVEGDRQPERPFYRWIDDILKWCCKDLRVAALMTSDGTEWWKFMTRPK